MKAMLLLTNAVLVAVVVIVVVVGGRLSYANSLESNDNNFAFEKRGNAGSGRVRRDLTSFQSQIQSATSLRLGDIDICPVIPCTSNLSLDLCKCFCESNVTAFTQMITSLNTCYLNGICGKNLSTIKLSNVNVPLAVDNYDGQCYLYGPDVNMTLVVSTWGFLSLDFPTIYGYTLQYNLQYTFEGLSVRCRPNTPCAAPMLSPTNACDCQNSSGGGDNPSGNQIGVCNCNTSSPDKRQVATEGTAPAAGFESAANIFLEDIFDPAFIFYPDKRPYMAFSQEDVSVGKVVDGVPSDYRDQVEDSIFNAFVNSQIFPSLTSNYFSILSALIDDFRSNKCPPASC